MLPKGDDDSSAHSSGDDGPRGSGALGGELALGLVRDTSSIGGTSPEESSSDADYTLPLHRRARA